MALALYDQGDEAATSCKGWSWQSWWKPFAIYDEYMTEEDFDGYDPDERYDHFEYERDMGAVAAWPPGPIAPRTLSAERRMVRGGLRVYKIVVLGDGGVGKSGESASGSPWPAHSTASPSSQVCLYCVARLAR